MAKGKTKNIKLIYKYGQLR